MELGKLIWFGHKVMHVSGTLSWKDKHGKWQRTCGVTLPVGKKFTRMDVVALNEGIQGGIPPTGTDVLFEPCALRDVPCWVME